MNNFISNDDFVAILNETLDAEQDFSFNPTGSSMKPMLNGTTDSVVLTSKPEKLKKYDVVFFRRKSDKALVLHRIVKCADDGTFVISGDSQYYFDRDVSYDDIYAVLKSFIHNGKKVATTDFTYCVYSRLILIWKYSRIFVSKLYHKIFK